MTARIVILVISTLLTIFWVIGSEAGYARHADYIKPLKDNKSHPLYMTYGVGFFILDRIHYSFHSLIDNRRIAQAKIVFGEKYGEYYYHINVAEKFSLSFMAVVAGFDLYCVSGEMIMVLVGVFAAVILFWFVDTRITDVIENREAEIDYEFADMVSKLTLLINAGMIMREAWSEVAYASEGLIYQEMRTSIQLMQNGISEEEAYIAFGARCYSKRVKKFISMLVQNLTKGNKELVAFLKQSTKESWEERKHYVKRKGEAAATKLLLPIGLMFAGILIMIVVPIFGNMGL